MVRETPVFVKTGSVEGVSIRMAFVPKHIVRAIIAYVVLTFAVFELAVGQHHHATAPTRPAGLMAGLGNVHHPVSARNAEAQQFIRTGDHDAAARSNEQAAAVDRAYLQRTGARGIYPAMYYNHNLHFLVEAYGRTGQLGEATRAAQQLAESAKAHLKEMPMIEFFLPYSYFALLRFAQWDQVLRMPAPEGDLLTTRAMWHFARGVAFATTGKTDQARQEQKAFEDAAKTIPPETPYDLNSAGGVLQVAARVLDARIAWATGDRRKAIESWRGAVAAQDALNYAEPPDWYYPVRESLAAALFLTGDATGAEKVFREDLKNNPRNGRSLYGLMESLKEQGKQDAARWVEGEFKAAWKKAEVQLKMKDL